MRPGDIARVQRRTDVLLHAFALLCGRAAARRRVSYADVAFELGLGSPRGLGWVLTPILRWCQERNLPPLPIIVVRRSDRLPSGGYDPDLIAPETMRVFDTDWTRVTPPNAEEVFTAALRSL